MDNTKENILEAINNPTPYFEEEKDLFDQNIEPVDEQWGDDCSEGDYDEGWGAYIDEKKGLHVVLKTLIERLRADYHFICPIDTKVLHIYMNGIYDPSGEAQIRKLLDGKFGTTAHRETMAEVMEHLKDGSFIRREKINAENGHLPLHNGILNLEELELEAFSPDRIWTFKIPIWYEKGAECPHFKKMLDGIFENDEEAIRVIQEEFGYCLYPGMPARKSFWWYGSGANGKTSLANILVGLLGSKNVSSVDLRTLEDQRFAVGSLYGKLANVIGEPNPKRMVKSNVFKAVTGRDPITADVKFHDAIQFKNIAKMLVYANEYPDIRDQTEAFWDRVIVTGFLHRFIGNDDTKNIAETITEDGTEMSGVLNWALEGLRRLQENSWEFSSSKTAEEEKQAFMRQSNPVNAFISACCRINEGGFETTADLYRAYISFCENAEIGICSEKSFTGYLSGIGGIYPDRKTVGGRRVRGWRGIEVSLDSDFLTGDEEDARGLNKF